MVVWWVGAILGGISCSLFSRDVQKNFFFSYTQTTCNFFFVNNFLTFSNFFKFFQTFSKNFFWFHSFTCIYMFCLFMASEGLAQRGGHCHSWTGCVTCHTCHGCVTDFRPILGNPVEVTHEIGRAHV